MIGRKVSTSGPKIGEHWSFALQFLGDTYEHTIRRNQFKKIPRRLAKFRENWLRDVDKSVDGKKDLACTMYEQNITTVFRC